MMLRTATWTLLTAALLFAVGCGATIHSTVAPSANLAKYHTYAFYTPRSTEGQPQTPAKQAIRSALQNDLAAKGLTPATNGAPDFLVAYHVKTQRELDVAPIGYGVWDGNATAYTQGTLIIDFIDPQTMQAFWRGTASEVVNHPENPSPEKIAQAVHKLVDKYPGSTVAATARTPM